MVPAYPFRGPTPMISILGNGGYLGFSVGVFFSEVVLAET